MATQSTSSSSSTSNTVPRWGATEPLAEGDLLSGSRIRSGAAARFALDLQRAGVGTHDAEHSSQTQTAPDELRSLKRDPRSSPAFPASCRSPYQPPQGGRNRLRDLAEGCNGARLAESASVTPVRIVMRPGFPSSASEALMTRFMTICRNWDASASMSGNADDALNSRVAFFEIELSKSDHISWITVLRLTGWMRKRPLPE